MRRTGQGGAKERAQRKPTDLVRVRRKKTLRDPDAAAFEAMHEITLDTLSTEVKRLFGRK